MLYTTKAIVLHHTHYSESSVIIQAYTELFGSRSYILKGVRSAKSKTKQSLLYPLSILEVVAYDNKKSTLQNIKEIQPNYIYTGIPCHIQKTAIALFLTEILYKTLKEQGQDPLLFSFLENSFKHLDQAQHPVYNFQLVFMTELAKYLGFAPQNNYTSTCTFFDLREGSFQPNPPEHPIFLTDKHSEYFSLLLKAEDYSHEFPFNNTMRQELLTYLIDYYRIHLPAFSHVQSHSILHEILR